MKLLKRRDELNIACQISQIIQTISHSNMELDDVEFCLDRLFVISYTVGGTLNTKVVYKKIEDEKFKGIV